jgi:erythronate-4-phosphate dehydrogenase
MINSKFIRDIENKILINTSRGGIVSEKEIIKNNKLRYISDVWENEPVPTKDIINYSLISTPHIAGHSYNGKINGTIFLIKELQRYIKLSSEIQKNNIDTINNNFLNTKTAKTYKLEDYLEAYNIKDESDNFKLTYEGSSDNEFSKTFKKRRKNHPFRRDIY